MSGGGTVDRAYIELAPKRAFDEVPVDFDWHDLLANLPVRGKAYTQGAMVRLRRRHPRANGYQFEATTGGVTGADEPRWPKVLDATVQDGTVVWTARALASTSLRTTVSSNNAPAITGLTLTGPTVEDLVYRYLVAGGVAGQSYDIAHRVVLANGEDKELVGRLPVIG